MEQARIDDGQRHDGDEDDFDAMLDNCAAELQGNTDQNKLAEESKKDGDANDSTPFDGKIIDNAVNGA